VEGAWDEFASDREPVGEEVGEEGYPVGWMQQRSFASHPRRPLVGKELINKILCSLSNKHKLTFNIAHPNGHSIIVRISSHLLRISSILDDRQWRNCRHIKVSNELTH
jgi:hypothetical protein